MLPRYCIGFGSDCLYVLTLSRHRVTVKQGVTAVIDGIRIVEKSEKVKKDADKLVHVNECKEWPKRKFQTLI